ncbi:MAG TPA: hypothetical protein VMZ22_11460 [Acidimicrobiales bacterium]|nr:hypothetical protein [Acidimicrobiales bacterium]
MTSPVTIPCTSCFRADEVTAVVKDGKWVYTCTDHRPEPHVWIVDPPEPPAKKTAPKVSPASPARYLESVGANEVLAACLRADDPWVEYGVVEDRFRRAEPELYAHLVETYSHSARSAERGGPDVDKVSKTLSSRLAQALGRLATKGVVSKAPARREATGYWSYNGKVSYWGPNPAPESDAAITWEQYATDADDLDPAAWTLPE